jgi:hypothetical protein
MSIAGRPRGPKGGTPCGLGRPTRGHFAYRGRHKEADQ